MKIKKDMIENFGLKRFLFLMCMVCSTLGGNAQDLEITANYGYQFGTRLNYGRNYLKITDGDQFGVGLGFSTGNDFVIELTYMHQASELRINDRVISIGEERLSDVSMDLVQLGGIRYFDNGGSVLPFVGGGAGLAFFSPSNENRDLVSRSLDSSTEFAFSFKGGVRIMMTDAFGISLQGDLIFPVEWGGVYIAGGPGGGGGGVSLATTTIIGSVSGGVFFRI